MLGLFIDLGALTDWKVALADIGVTLWWKIVLEN